MMYVWRGHVYAGCSVLTAIACALGMVVSFRLGSHDDWGWLIIVSLSFLSGVLALIFGALAYALWVPKWERDERRTGHIPGERRDSENQTLKG